ncbi:hypothetical protein N0V83_000064 [Neocucurbitaria cava]|uniref:NADP-dependent oxidoreductase domain-containing protein n=1 Tax=Neocucurbitaria cava TaxID=798079 RepID=A0A9W9CQT5_9PLEO|nr:hypothetical protein N0V83_000064 [Neocucurbitaria cava]
MPQSPPEQPAQQTPSTSPLRLPLILGGAGFSYQLSTTPSTTDAVSILLTAFAAGIRTIDTSPYYDPSELILGSALCDPRITTLYQRSDYTLMTKVGRIAADEFDYSDAWVRRSVQRSLERFHTGYLDVVFCHDVEFVSLDDAVRAVGTLLDLVHEGKVRYVGISGYKLDVLARVAARVLQVYGQPVDVVQTWAQLTLLNTRLETVGLSALKAAGVRNVCASSPLVVGLLSSKGVPVGRLGDWHPAPQGLRVQAKKAAEYVEGRGEDIASLALRFAIRKAVELSADDDHEMQISTISGVASVEEIVMNIATARQVLGDRLDAHGRHKHERAAKLEQRDDGDCRVVREIFGEWLDHDFS